MATASSSSSSSSASFSSATAAPPASLLQLHSVFALLDSISPSLPASQSLTLPKLKEALSIYAQWSFPDDSAPSNESSRGSEDADRRRKRREEKEEMVRDIIDGVDLNKNGKIEFNELMKVMDAPPSHAADEADDDEEWEPTRENVRAVFNAADKDRDGFLSMAELKLLLRSQGVDYLSEAQILDMASSIDPASSTAAGVNFPAFLRMMTTSVS